MKPGRRTWRSVSAVGLLTAMLLAGSAGWVHAKAALAQILLQRAWQQSQTSGQRIKPWPWADMAPIARLRVPKLSADLIVLDSDSGQALAFGPGWTPSSAQPGERGISVISAHRDTQFQVLQQLHKGDVITLSGLHAQRSYRVVVMRIVDSRQARLPNAASGDALLLVTCYPFDAVLPGGPLRYVVEADPLVPSRS